MQKMQSGGVGDLGAVKYGNLQGVKRICI
jgi:hypothetical protein